MYGNNENNNNEDDFGIFHVDDNSGYSNNDDCYLRTATFWICDNTMTVTIQTDTTTNNLSAIYSVDDGY
jgi:hypothetical protein